MRGLTLFIDNVRQCTPEDEEKLVKKEMAKIRKKLHEQKKSLDGYNRRKHIAKLLFMYLLGYESDFAYNDALRLCTSQKIPEKLIGYVTVQVVLQPENSMVPELLPTLKADLTSGNEVHICLALAAAANIGGSRICDLAPNVRALITGTATGPMVTKKAVLCLLRMYRTNRAVLEGDWAPIFSRLLASNNVGVLMSTLALLNQVTADSPSTFFGLYDDVVNIFARVITGKRYEADYVYYRVPCPWLQVLILKWLQFHPNPPSSTTKEKVIEMVSRVVTNVGSVAKEPNNQKNAFYSILFECVPLVILLRNDDLMRDTAMALGTFLSDRGARPNHVYGGLQAMTKLARIHSGASNLIKEHQSLIIGSLSAGDTSIQRLCLDLTYGLCDKKSSGSIVAELLAYLQRTMHDSSFADLSARDELVLKISILAERYSLSYRWYVDVMLKLITLAGDHMNDYVWYRTIKLITNQEDLQEYATQTLFVALQEPGCNLTALKIACYILGEYGDMIANHPQCSAQILFNVVHSHFQNITDERTKASILSTYMKFINLFPVLTPTILAIFEQYKSSVDPELQQRACEYMTLAQMGDKAMLSIICEIMPAYEDFKADAAPDDFSDQSSESEDDKPIVFTPIALPEDKPPPSFIPGGPDDPEVIAQKARDAKAAKAKQQALEDAANAAAEALQNDFRDKQKQLADQENTLKKAEQELLEQERAAQRKLEKLEARQKQKQEDSAKRKEEQMRSKKEEIAQHFQAQALVAQEQLQQQALLAQQQQMRILQEQQHTAELELQAAAIRVVQQQDAEIQARKAKAEAELQAQLGQAKQMHDAAIAQQGARAQALLEKEKELAAIQAKIQEDFQKKQEEINKEAERAAAAAAMRVQQEQAARAEQLRIAAAVEEQKLREREAQLAAQAARLQEQERRVREAEQKELALAARERALMEQQALLVQKAQQAQEHMLKQKAQLELEAQRERERIAAQTLLQQQEQAKLVALAQQEQQRLAMVAAKEQEKIKQQQAMMQQQALMQQQAAQMEQQRLLALAQQAEKEKQEAERAKHAALQQQVAAQQQAQAAAAMSLAQQQAASMAASVEASRLKAAQAQSAEKQADLARKLAIQLEGVMQEDQALQVGMKSQYQTGKGRMEVFFTNKTAAPFTAFNVVLPPVPYLTYQLQPPVNTIGPGQQTSCVLVFSCDAPFETYPEMAISFTVGGTSQQAKIKLPITITRFCDPLPLDAPTFSTRWTQINGPPQEVVAQFTAVNNPVPEHVAGLFTSGFRWAILPGVDPNPNNLVGAATFHSSRGSVYCYMRLETNQQAQMIRLTLKSGSAEITNAMKNVFLAHLSKDHQPKPAAATPAATPNPFATNSGPTPIAAAPAVNPFATNTNRVPTPGASPFLTNTMNTQITVAPTPVGTTPGYGVYQPVTPPPGGFNPFATIPGSKPAGPQLTAAQILTSTPGQFR